MWIVALHSLSKIGLCLVLQSLSSLIHSTSCCLQSLDPQRRIQGRPLEIANLSLIYEPDQQAHQHAFQYLLPAHRLCCLCDRSVRLLQFLISHVPLLTAFSQVRCHDHHPVGTLHDGAHDGDQYDSHSFEHHHEDVDRRHLHHGDSLERHG